MKNLLVETIENEFKNVGIDNAKLVSDSCNMENFGNAEAVYDLDNLRLHFFRDRGQDILNISSLSSPEICYSFSDISLMMGWEALDEIINVTIPISLNKALGYIKSNLDSLNEAFSINKILSTDIRLKNAQEKRIKAMFG